jgi:hypothetical protein
MDFQTLVEALAANGPWAIVALLFIGIGFVARAYVKARDNHETFMKQLIDQMQGVLVDSTAASTRQSETNERVNETLARLERRVEHVETRN